MRFDDRLSTVLGLSAEAPRDRAVQWRQLVEIVARGGGAGDPALLARALRRISELHHEVPDSVRASAARSLAGSELPAPLLAIFAADPPEMVAPLLAGAELSPDEWEIVRANASPGVRDLVNSISPPVVVEPAPPAPPKPAKTTWPTKSETSEPGLFRWECGPDGNVRWVDGAPRASLVGFSLAEALEGRFVAQLPFRDEPIDVVASGEWLWSGSPRFEPSSGRFSGYSGEGRKPGAISATASAGDVQASDQPMDTANLRELIHELRTPLTAIIGFGEIIEGQHFGPAHRTYRDRAGEIVKQARHLLAAVEELDLAAKQRAGRAEGGRASLASIIDAVERSLAPLLARRGLTLSKEIRKGADEVLLHQELAVRLIGRLLQAVAEVAPSGHSLSLVAEQRGTQAAISINRSDVASASDSFTLALRLVEGLAAVAGGGLDASSDPLVLVLPPARL